MKRFFWSLFLWVWTIVFFMIIMPIGFVIQGVIGTPFEIIYNSIKEKRIVKPDEYWERFYFNIANKFYDGYLRISEANEEES